MSQTKKHSGLEAMTNTIIGIVLAFGISQLAHHYEWFIQKYIWTSFKWDLSASSNAVMTLVLTIISVIRGYTIRRLFNNLNRVEYENKNS